MIEWKSELENKSVAEQINKFNEIMLNIIAQHTSEIGMRRKNYKSKFYRERRALWRRRARLQKRRMQESIRDKLLEDI